MKKLIIINAILLLLIPAPMVWAGFSDSDMDAYDKHFHKFKYDIDGEIEVKPDRVHFPVTIFTKAESFRASLKKAKDILQQLQKKLQKEKEEKFIISPADFFEPRSNTYKLLDISFFKKEKNESTTNLTLYFTIKFEENESFWDRSENIAKAMDFLDNFIKKYDKDETVNISKKEVVYEVDNKEKYREKIIQRIYEKTKKVADIIGEKEGKKAKIKEIKFDQKIKDDILNFNRALLSINAFVEYSFE